MTVARADARVTRCRMSNIATNKWLHALIGVILVIKLLIRWLPVKLSHFPFTHSLLIFWGNFVPKNNCENRQTGWVRILQKCQNLYPRRYHWLSPYSSWSMYRDTFHVIRIAMLYAKMCVNRQPASLYFTKSLATRAWRQHEQQWLTSSGNGRGRCWKPPSMLSPAVLNLTASVKDSKSPGFRKFGRKSLCRQLSFSLQILESEPRQLFGGGYFCRGGSNPQNKSKSTQHRPTATYAWHTAVIQ